MVQFVNVREFKTKTEAVFRKLQRGDIVLTTHGKPRAKLQKITERDLSFNEEFTEEEWAKLQLLAKNRGTVYKSGAEAIQHMKNLSTKR